MAGQASRAVATWAVAVPAQRISPTCLVFLSAFLLPACTLLLDFSDPVGPASDGGPSADAAADAPPTSDMCGDGLIQAPEECDDNNSTNLDGCAASCKEEAGYTCSGEASVCNLEPICPALSIVNAGAILDSCLSYYNAGYRASGRYRIDVDGAASREGFDVICDMSTAGGGWTVVVNNAADLVEPEGCLPRLATVDAFACGTPSCNQDYAVPVYGMPFTELAWAVHDGSFTLGPHNLFRWTSSQTLANTSNWSVNADQSGQRLAGLESETLIQCQRAGLPFGLLRIANENVVAASGGFTTADVVTVFDQDTSVATPGNMSFTDVDTIGLDDFQDGNGCGDLWAPLTSRGAATLIMIR